MSGASQRRHGARESRMHIGGPPCTDWSTMGTRQGQYGPAAFASALWLIQRIMLKEQLVVHENVPEYDTHLLEIALGSIYIIFSSIIDPSTLGWAISRPRKISVLIRRDVFTGTFASYNQFVASCARVSGPYLPTRRPAI